MLNTLINNFNKWKEKGSLPLVLIAVMLIASTGVLLTMLSISQAKATEQTITNTNLTSAFTSCKSFLTTEVGKSYSEIPANLTPTVVGGQTIHPSPDECQYNDLNTAVKILDAALYPNATAPTQIKFTLEATYAGFENTAKTETHYVALPEVLPVGLIEEDWQIVGFDDAGHAIWGPTADELGPPVKTRQPIIKWNETAWNSWGFDLADLNDPSKGAVCENPALTPEYSWRTKMQGAADFTDWTNWTKTAPATVSISSWNSGLQHAVQVKTRCVTVSGNAARENVGAEQIKLRPMLTPPAPASITWSAPANYGLTWSAASCAINPGSSVLYSWRWYNGTTWTNWSSYTTATTISNPNNASALLQEGQFGQAEVKTVCLNSTSHTYSPDSPSSSTGPFYRPITAPPAPATLTFSAPNYGLTWTNASGTVCSVGTAQYSVRVNKGGWGAWSAWQTALTTNTNYLAQGETGTAEVKTRCFVSAANVSNESPARSSGSYTRTPNPPAAPTNVRWSAPTTVAWNAVTCATGTTPQYRYSTQQNTNAWSAYSGWQTGVTATSNVLNPGDRGNVRAQARCVVGTVVSDPSGTTTSAQYTRPNTAPSATPTGSWNAANGTLTFSSPTCATGSTVNVEYRAKTLTTGNYTTNPALGTYGSWVSSSAGATTASIMNQGYPARAEIRAECVNTTTGVTSNYTSTTETAWQLRNHTWAQGPSHSHSGMCTNGSSSSCNGTGKYTSAATTCPAGSKAYVEVVSGTAQLSGSKVSGTYDVYAAAAGAFQATGGNDTARITARTRTSSSGGGLGSHMAYRNNPATTGFGTNWMSIARSTCWTPYTLLQTTTWRMGSNPQGGWLAAVGSRAYALSTTSASNVVQTNANGTFNGNNRLN